jgi:hypothetical protein
MEAGEQLIEALQPDGPEKSAEAVATLKAKREADVPEGISPVAHLKDKTDALGYVL